MEKKTFHNIKIVREPGSQIRHVYLDGMELHGVEIATIQYRPCERPTVWLSMKTNDIEIDEPEAEVLKFTPVDDGKRVIVDRMEDDRDGLETEEGVRPEGSPAAE